MLDNHLQIISPCIMQHVWIGAWPSEFIWMCLLCIVLSVQMSSSWRLDAPFIVHRTGEEHITWWSLKALFIKLALSVSALQRKPTWGLPLQAEVQDQPLSKDSSSLLPSVTSPSLFPLSHTPVFFYCIPFV